MKESKFYQKTHPKEKKYTWLSKLLISIIFILLSLITTNLNSDFSSLYKEEVLNKNISFVDFNQFYEKYVGKITKKQKEEFTFNEQNASPIEYEGNTAKIKVGSMENVSILKPGIIVYIGEKEDLGNTIIIQGNDGVDIWYSHIKETPYSLYDYVSSGNLLGICEEDTLFITIKKDDTYLKYEDYIGQV